MSGKLNLFVALISITWGASGCRSSDEGFSTETYTTSSVFPILEIKLGSSMRLYPDSNLNIEVQKVDFKTKRAYLKLTELDTGKEVEGWQIEGQVIEQNFVGELLSLSEVGPQSASITYPTIKVEKSE